MSDRDPIWDDIKTYKKQKFAHDRAAFLSAAIKSDDGGWTKHTEHHWSRVVAGSRLDYWPSRKKFMWREKVQRGDVIQFIAKATGSAT